MDLVVENTTSAFTRDCEPGDRLSIPVKHMSGRYFAPPEQLDALEANGQVALRYAPGQNPNGSERDIAGVVNEAGNVLGLMPHPEHAVDRSPARSTACGCSPRSPRRPSPPSRRQSQSTLTQSVPLPLARLPPPRARLPAKNPYVVLSLATLSLTTNALRSFVLAM